MKKIILLSLLLASAASAAETPRQIAELYATEATRLMPGFEPNAGLGEHLYTRATAASARPAASCVACHAEIPLRENRQFDPMRVEQRLARDCTAVIGRECTAGEKADLLAYLVSAE